MAHRARAFGPGADQGEGLLARRVGRRQGGEDIDGRARPAAADATPAPRSGARRRRTSRRGPTRACPSGGTAVPGGARARPTSRGRCRGRRASYGAGSCTTSAAAVVPSALASVSGRTRSGRRNSHRPSGPPTTSHRRSRTWTGCAPCRRARTGTASSSPAPPSVARPRSARRRSGSGSRNAPRADGTRAWLRTGSHGFAPRAACCMLMPNTLSPRQPSTGRIARSSVAQWQVVVATDDGGTGHTTRRAHVGAPARAPNARRATNGTLGSRPLPRSRSTHRPAVVTIDVHSHERQPSAALWWAMRGSNPRPPACHADALTS